MNAPIQLPVQALEWACHAPTTIKDASGAVIAECSGHGRECREDVAIAAEIVRRVNAHGELVSLARRWAALDAGDWHPVRYASERARLLADTRAAIGVAEGGASSAAKHAPALTVDDLQRELLAICKGHDNYETWARVSGQPVNFRINEVARIGKHNAVRGLRQQIHALNPNAALYFGWCPGEDGPTAKAEFFAALAKAGSPS